jgi:hypothetical protein
MYLHQNAGQDFNIAAELRLLYERGIRHTMCTCRQPYGTKLPVYESTVEFPIGIWTPGVFWK